jgi:hypothetical protein
MRAFSGLLDFDFTITANHLVALSLYHRQHHLKSFNCLQGMWLIGWHYNHLTLFHPKRFSRDADFRFAIKYMN